MALLRIPSRHVVLIVSLVAATSMFAQSGVGQDKTRKTTPDEIVVFKPIDDGADLSLHVYLPASGSDGVAEPRSAIVLFFGGGWVSGSASHFADQARYLADRGIVAICPEYRTKKSHSTDPKTCVSDGKSAMRYVRAHAKRWNINPDRIAAGGGSAGGHVAAATSLVDAFDDPTDDASVSCRPDALVLFNPVFDNGPDQWGHKTVTDYWQDISPAHRIDKDAVPTLVMLGTQDKLIPVATAQRYQDAMKAVGVRCDLELYEGGEHGFFNHGEAYEQTIKRADDFLVELGFLKPEAD